MVFLTGCSSVESNSYLQEIDAHYDLASVTAFLRIIVSQHQIVDGVSLVETKIGGPWVVDQTWIPVGLSAGDWTFQRSLSSGEVFTLSFRSAPHQAVSFHCRREKKDVFTLMSFEKVELVSVTDGRLKL